MFSFRLYYWEYSWNCKRKSVFKNNSLLDIRVLLSYVISNCNEAVCVCVKDDIVVDNYNIFFIFLSFVEHL